jgi:pimeloyl-ACP methyl ester carboxylesterase
VGADGVPALALPADDAGGGGLPVVFLHALAGSSAQWTNQLSHLRPARRALALTLRGLSGAPDGHDGDWSIVALARDVLHTLDVLELARVALVGHSIGAHVALACAALEPQRIVGLLLADPAGCAREAPRAAASALMCALESGDYQDAIAAHYRTLLIGSRPAVAQRVLADLCATPRATVAGVLRAAPDFDPLQALAAYGGPTFAVDTYLREQPWSLHHLSPTLRSTRLGDTSHWLQLDRPHEFNLILDGWMSGLNSVRREASVAGAARPSRPHPEGARRVTTRG